MIGVVIVTHCGLGSELISTAEFILGRIPGIIAVTIDAQASADIIRAGVEAGIKNVDQGDGIIILTDMFGGTPSIISLSFLAADQIEVLQDKYEAEKALYVAAIKANMSLAEKAIEST